MKEAEIIRNNSDVQKQLLPRREYNINLVVGGFDKWVLLSEGIVPALCKSDGSGTQPAAV